MYTHAEEGVIAVNILPDCKHLAGRDVVLPGALNGTLQIIP